MRTRYKILIALVTALIWFWAEQTFGRQKEVCDLQADFASYNQDYFLGQLPNTEAHFGDLSAEKDLGLTQRSHKPDVEFEIIVDRRLNPDAKEARLTLLHEACHIKTWKTGEFDHGSKWHACMLNLAERGAFDELW